MRNLIVIMLLSFASACAVRAPQTTLPREYACGDGVIVPEGNNRLAIRAHTASLVTPSLPSPRLGWRDESGDHYLAGPMSPVDVEAVELVIPNDAHSDATRRVYDTSTGTSRSDWRLIKAETCMLRGGDVDVLSHYAKGASLDDLAHDFALGDRTQAKEVVYRAMITLQRRYFHDH